jgi:hypothetical protein
MPALCRVRLDIRPPADALHALLLRKALVSLARMSYLVVVAT